MVLYISVKFRENITNGIRGMETGVQGDKGYVQFSKHYNSKVGKPELRFMVLYIGVKFRYNISNGIRVMERTRNYEPDGRTFKILDCNV